MQTVLFKASQLAKWCNVDLKTIHNWVDKGQVKAGRTPGRHLRFTAETVRKVLVGLDVPIPQEVTDALPKQEVATPQ